MAWRHQVAQMITAVIMFPISYPKSPEASPRLLQLPPRSHILLFVPAVMMENKVKGSKGPLPVFLQRPPWPLSVLGGRLLWILAHNQFILITSGSAGERRANWLAGICIYSTQQNVTNGLGGDLCGLLAKQTDEGNLSCSLCSIEQGQPRPLLLALSVTCHAAVGTRRGEMRWVNTRGDRRGAVKSPIGQMIHRCALFWFFYISAATLTR